MIINLITFQGGSITWKPVDSLATGSTVEIVIYQTHSWTLGRFYCDQTMIDNLNWYNDGGSLTVWEPFVNCYSGAACSSSLFSLIRERTYCTDYSTTVQSSTGALIKKVILSRNTQIIVGFVSAAWAPEIIATGTNSSAGWWHVLVKIDLTTTPINSSPGRTICCILVCQETYYLFSK